MVVTGTHPNLSQGKGVLCPLRSTSKNINILLSYRELLLLTKLATVLLQKAYSSNYAYHQYGPNLLTVETLTKITAGHAIEEMHHFMIAVT